MKDDFKQKSDLIDLKGDITKVVKQNGALKNYFSRLADYDKQIGNADIGFLSGELSRLGTGSNALFARLKPALKATVGKALKLLIGTAAERTADLVLTTASCFNPLAFITGGCTVMDIKDAAEDLSLIHI